MKYILYARGLEFAYYANDKQMMEEYLTLSFDLIDSYTAQYEKSHIQYLLMVIVRATIILKQYDKGIHYCNLWYQIGVSSYSEVQARLFSIIVHFELNYLELIESEIILLKKLEIKYERDKALIRSFYTFIHSILKHPDQRNTFILQLQKDLASISKNNKNYFSFISFDYYQWSLKLNSNS